MLGRSKSDMSRAAAGLLNKSETLIIAGCTVRHHGRDLSGVSTFYSFSSGGVEWHISSARLCNGGDVLRFELQRGKKKERHLERKVSCFSKVDDMSGSLVCENGSREFEAVKLFFDDESKLPERTGLIS